LQNLDDSKLPGFYLDPVGPHSVGNFKVWTPKEYLADLLSFIMLNRGDLSVLLHPLGRTELDDHTSQALWLGEGTRFLK